MEISKIAAVIFDLDGTLVRLPINYLAMREELRNLALKYGVHSEFRPIIGEIERLSKLVKDGKEFMNSCFKIIDGYENRASGKATLIKGAKDCLLLMKNKGKRIAVVSNNSTSCVKDVLKRTELFEYIDVIVGRNGVRVKPDPYPVVLAIKKLGVENESVIMIGDSENDVRAAERAGIKYYIFNGGDLLDLVMSNEGLQD